MTNFKLHNKLLNEALINLDVQLARKINPTALDDKTIFVALHKARYEKTDINAKLRHNSRKWLQKNGFHRLDGVEFLPDDELPK